MPPPLLIRLIPMNRKSIAYEYDVLMMRSYYFVFESNESILSSDADPVRRNACLAFEMLPHEAAELLPGVEPEDESLKKPLRGAVVRADVHVEQLRRSARREGRYGGLGNGHREADERLARLAHVLTPVRTRALAVRRLQRRGREAFEQRGDDTRVAPPVRPALAPRLVFGGRRAGAIRGARVGGGGGLHWS